MTNGLIEQELLERLAALPREITPDGDAWPAIEKRIGHEDTSYRQQPSSRWWMHAVAASVAVVFVAGFLIGRQWDTLPGMAQPGVDLAKQEQAAFAGEMAGALTASEFEYQAAFREFISVGDSRENFTLKTVNDLAAGWADLSAAEAALTEALRKNPGNTFLSAKMLELWSRQLDFLKQIASLDQNSRRTTI
jgi:hypothetical protein